MKMDERGELLVVDNSEVNRGVAASWNIGARHAQDIKADWLVCCSAAMRFMSPNLGGFLDRLEENPTLHIVESQPEVTWHLIAFAVSTLERVGLFDENYWPGYGEEVDYSYRMVLSGLAQEAPNSYWTKVNVDGYVESRAHSQYLGGIIPDHAALSRYHRAKWGAPIGGGNESFQTPFNDPRRDYRWWPTPPDDRCYSPSPRPDDWGEP
jgi:hypothetical protein